MGGTNPPQEKKSRKEDWETFWKDKEDVQQVYSNSDRILRGLLHAIDLKGKLVLEVGAGTGRDSFPMIQYGASVVQLDYAENSLRILKKLAEERRLPATIVAGDTFQLPFSDGTFDVVFHQGLLEHFHQAQADALLRENIRVLKPGGLLLVDVPQRYHPYTLAKHVLMALNKWFGGWERSFSVGELQNRLSSAGLTPVYSYGEWMYPSFFYRSTREALKAVGISLPLKPRPVKSLTRFRGAVRSALMRTRLSLHTGMDIGVIGRKQN